MLQNLTDRACFNIVADSLDSVIPRVEIATERIKRVTERFSL
jgi:hypothetical protein